MKIIIAPDKYKGSLTAKEVCAIIEEVASIHFPDAEILKLPVADGGEGFVDTMLYASEGKKIYVKVKDPLMRDIEAYYGILDNGTVLIEMAAASGLQLLSSENRNALETTTYGTGQLILHALSQGYKEFVIGLGGSATNDGGAGVACALGIHYLDKNGQIILKGKDLVSVSRISTEFIVDGIKDAHFIFGCDVDNPLYGPKGAAHIYGPQKGGSKSDIELLDRGLMNLARVILKETEIDVQNIRSTGAAGGFVVPFIPYTNSEIHKGVDVVLDALNFDKKLDNCDLLITGEGNSDEQSSMGKVISGLGTRAKARGIPVIVISGALSKGYEKLYEHGVNALFSACRNITTIEAALNNAADNLRQSTEDVFRLLEISFNKHIGKIER